MKQIIVCIAELYLFLVILYHPIYSRMRQFINYLIFLSLLLFILKINAQNDSVNAGYSVGISPLSLIDASDGSSVRLNFEIPISNRITIGAEGGFYIFGLAYRENPKGYLIKPILKYYLNPKEHKMRYLAGEYMYKEISYNLSDSLDLNEVRLEKNYTINRDIHTFSVKYGEIYQLWKTFDLEWYAGIGIRFMNSTSELSPEEERAVLTDFDKENNIDHGDSPIKQLSRQSGKFVYPNVVLGIKILFSFKEH